MKKLLLLIPRFFLNFIHATESCFDSYIFKKEIEAKIKCDRHDHSNHIKFETSLRGFFENTDSWIDSKVKLSVKDSEQYSRPHKFEVDRLVAGYVLHDNEDSIFYVEAGRAKLDYLFNSKLQFNSYIHGFNHSFWKGNLTIHAAQNFPNGYFDYYGFVAEASYKNIANIPLTLSYTLTDWICENDYVISQISFNYFLGTLWNKSINSYGAFLRNHKMSDHCNGGYIGTSIGCLKQTNDWMLDINYQYTQCYTVPIFDYNGIWSRGVEMKAGFAFNENLSLQTKLAFADINRFELSTVFKW